MKKEIEQIEAAVVSLKGYVRQNELGISSPFSGLELPDIMRDVVDLLFPQIGPYEAAFYMYLLRNSIIENGQPYIRAGKTRLQYAVGSTFRNKSIEKLGESTVSGTLKALEKFGAIRKEGDPTNQLGTLYRILLPEEIEICQQRRHELQKETIASPENLEPDYYNIRENRQKVYERDDYKCRYCSKQLTRFTATLDHITAVANGGDNSLENLTTACIECNSKKNKKPVGDFIAESN